MRDLEDLQSEHCVVLTPCIVVCCSRYVIRAFLSTGNTKLGVLSQGMNCVAFVVLHNANVEVKIRRCR